MNLEPGSPLKALAAVAAIIALATQLGLADPAQAPRKDGLEPPPATPAEQPPR